MPRPPPYMDTRAPAGRPVGLVVSKRRLEQEKREALDEMERADAGTAEHRTADGADVVLANVGPPSCPTCKASGFVDGAHCPACEGRGFVSTRKP